jgi:hypothetical protein
VAAGRLQHSGSGGIADNEDYIRPFIAHEMLAQTEKRVKTFFFVGFKPSEQAITSSAIVPQRPTEFSPYGVPGQRQVDVLIEIIAAIRVLPTASFPTADIRRHVSRAGV